MNVTINGHAQIFEAGSCPTINIDLSGSPAPQQIQLPEEPSTGAESTQRGQTLLCKNKEEMPSATALCTYIIPNDIKTAEEIEQEMLAAARKNAPALANYIKHALRLGLIDLRGDDGKTVYETLKAHFGISYSYSNWMLYYS